MKNLLLAFCMASLFAACNSENKKDADIKTDMAPINTAGYKMSDATTDIAKYQEEEQDEVAVPKKRSAKKNAPVIYKEIVYVPREEKQNSTPAANPASPAPVPTTTPSETPTTSSTGNGSTTSNGDNKNTETTQTTETSTPKKKGWSNAAKGAVIGGAAGAIGGAIINGKNRGAGAVIGAVIGAAGGYVIGRKKDKNKEDVSPYSMVVN